MRIKWISIIGFLFLVVLLAACGGGEPATEEAAQPTATPKPEATEPAAPPQAESACPIAVEEGATIVFSGWGDETEQQIYRDSIDRFAEVCPDVTVDYQPIPADFQTKLKASMAGGTAPDVFYVDDQLMTAFAPTGQLLSLDDFMTQAGTGRGDFIPSLLSIFTLENNTYALPKDWGTLGLVYLPAAFEAAGIDEPTADWGWDDLKAAAEAIAATGEYAGFCQNADWARFAPWAFGNGGAYATDDFSAPLLNSSEIKEAAEYIAVMHDDGSLVSAADVGAGWCGEAIGKELAGMTYEGGWMVNYMRNDFPDVEWLAQELPTGPNGKADVIFTNGIGVNAATKYPQAAAAFTIFVTGADNQGEIVKTGFAYSTHPEQLDDVVDPNDAAIARGGTFDLTRVAYWGPNTGKVNDAVSQALERIYLGDQGVDEAFAQAQEEAAEFLTGEGAAVSGGIEAPAASGCPLDNLEEGATIVFSGWGDETEQQIYRDSIDRFAEVCPDVTVDYQPIPADFQTKLKASMAGGTAPDVFYVDDQLMTAFAPTGQLLSLDDFMTQAGTGRGDFIPALLSIFTQDGATYALPKDWGTLGLVYLPAAFEAAGIDEPTADWGWDDLKAAAEAIAATGEYAGFCQNADWARFAPWAFGNGGAYATDDFSAPLLNSSEIKEAAEYIAAMHDDGSLVSAADVGAGWCGEAIGKELAGMTYEGGWMVNYMRNDFPDVNWLAQELPTGPNGKADVIFTNGIGVNAATQYPNAAAAFAIFVTGADNQGEIVKTGFAYSTHPEQLDDVVDPNDAAIARGGTFDLTRVAYWGPNTGKVNDAVSQALERIYLGDQGVDEAFEQAQEEAAEFLTGEGAEVSGGIEAPAVSGCPLDNLEDGAAIVFSGWGDETEQQIYRDSIDRFAEVCPDVKVDYQPIPADFQTKLKASMAGGTAPDAFYVDDQLMTAFAPTGQLLSLDDFMAEAGTGRGDFIPSLLSIFTLENNTYALPKDWGTLGLVYLPAAFEAAGIDEPAADWGWDDLKAAAEAIAATGEYAGFCQNADWARFAPWAFGNGGAYTSDDLTTATVNTAQVKAAAEYIAAMHDDGSLVSAADVGAGWCGEAIGKELVGLTYEGGWMVNYMRSEFPDVNWLAQELPGGPAGKGDVIFTNGIGVNASSAYPRAAAAFAIFVTGAANQGEIVKTGFAYSTHPEQLDDVVDPNDAAIARGGTFELTRVAYWGPNTGKVNDAVSQALERIYLNDQGVDEAFEQANEEIQGYLDEAQ